jgi:hypothetical protein
VENLVRKSFRSVKASSESRLEVSQGIKRVKTARLSTGEQLKPPPSLVSEFLAKPGVDHGDEQTSVSGEAGSSGKRGKPQNSHQRQTKSFT